MRVQKCKGTCDLSAEDMKRFRFIEEVFRNSCLKWGYQEVRTPTIEYLHLFTSTGTLTPGTLGKVYSFLDWDGWSGERVVLRPEGTIPAVRLYIDNLANQKLARLSYIINTFIFEETGKENREKWQCGVELIGADSKLADVELITLALEVLKKLGIKNIELKLSHAGLIRALLTGFGLSPEEQSKVFDRILDGDVAVLTRLKAQTPELARLLTPLLDLKGKTAGFLRNLKASFNCNLPEFTPALDNFIEVIDLLETMGVKYKIDVASGRGFEYYTGIIFQLFAGETKLGGGGRYDALIPLMGGKNTPASGFALQIDALMNLIEIPPQIKSEAEGILIKPNNNQPKTVKSAYRIADSLRDKGFTVSMQLSNEDKAVSRWMIEVNEQSPGFVINDRTKKRKLTVKTTAELMKLLGGQGGS
ncbi:MAG: HisS family protein [Dehalococcoidales bacterium]|nr:HisS family protein [Dehalococcoidales bacterium]